MIVTIADCAPPGAGALVAESLARLRAGSVSKLLLLDAGAGQACQRWGAERERSHLRPALATRALRGLGCAAELERLHVHFRDIVIAIDGCRGDECRWALVGAQVALVPLAPDYADVDGRCASDIESSTGAAEMAALYGEVYRSAPDPACSPASGGQTLTTIWNQCRS